MTRKPVHPGAVFREDVFEPLHMIVADAAELLGVAKKTLSEFVHEKSALSPEMALRIAKATNTKAESWLAMQEKLTLWNARQNEENHVKHDC